MYLARTAKPLKPFKQGARGIKTYDASSSGTGTGGVSSSQAPKSKEEKIKVKGKNIPKRKPRVQAPTEAPSEYDVDAVQKFIDKSGAPDPDEIPHSKISSKTLAPVKSSKIGLPKQTGGLSTKIQPRPVNSVQPVKTAATKQPTKTAAATKTATVPATASTATAKAAVDTMSIKKKKDVKLYNQLVTTIEPESSEDELLQEALDGEYEESDEGSEEVEGDVDDDDLLSE